MRFLEALGRFAHFAFRTLAALIATRPAQILRPLYDTMAGALPLGLAAGAALGVVVWLHLHSAVSREYQQRVPEFLALAVVLEFAPLGAGLVVAGRSGASLGAELSSMRLTEQLDALEALGVSPMRHLIGPRVWAAMITLPVLTVFIALTALASSVAAEMIGGSLSWTQYQQALWRGLDDAPVISATLKTIAGAMDACRRAELPAQVTRTDAEITIEPEVPMAGCERWRVVIRTDGSGGRRELWRGERWVDTKWDHGLTPAK